MTSYGYVIMTMADSCMIRFHFDSIMQLKKSHHIATNVCSRKSATTFGDLPDWLGWDKGCLLWVYSLYKKKYQLPGICLTVLSFLTHCGLVMPYVVRDLSQHWFMLWLVAWWHQAITWTNVDLSLSMYFEIHQKAISQEVIMNLIHKMFGD